MIIAVSVTQDDIDRGIVADVTKCPAARAISRALGIRVSVDQVKMIFGETGEPVAIVGTPRALADFITIFDVNGASAAEPCEFELDVPAKLVPVGAR